jgi:hypothetical protein
MNSPLPATIAAPSSIAGSGTSPQTSAPRTIAQSI